MGWLMKRFVRKTERRLFTLLLILIAIGLLIVGATFFTVVIVVIGLILLKFIIGIIKKVIKK